MGSLIQNVPPVAINKKMQESFFVLFFVFSFFGECQPLVSAVF